MPSLLIKTFSRYAARGDRTRTAPLRRYATNLHAIYATLAGHKPRIVHTTIITRVRAGEVGGAHYPKRRRSLLIHAETRDFHSRRGMGARTIAWGRCTPLTIVDQFSIKISGFTPSFEALGRLLKKKKKKKKKKKEYDDENAYERFLV